MIGRVLREIAVFLFFLGLAVVLTWPVAIRLRTIVPDLGDPLLNAWILDWVCHALTHRPLDLFDAPIFYPGVMPLAYSENLIGVALVVLPFHLAGLSALTVYNIALLLGFAHAGYGGFVLARVVTRGGIIPPLVAGIFFAFMQFKFDHLSHLQVIWSGWVPLLLAALIAFWQRPTTHRAALVGGALVMNGLTNIYLLLFSGVALALSLGVLALSGERRDRAVWVRLGAALILAGLFLLPILLPYRHVSKLYGMKRDPAEIAQGSATPADWFTTTERNRAYERFVSHEKRRPERVLFPGLFPLFLAGTAMLLTPRRAPSAFEAGRATEAAATGQARLLRGLDILIVVLAALVWFAWGSDRFVITWRGVILLALRGTSVPMVLLVAAIVTRLAIRFPRALGGDEGRSLRTALAGSRFGAGEWVAMTWIVAGVLGSFGLNSFFHTFLYERVEGFGAIRATGRWAVVTYAGLVVWMALGAAELLRRGTRRRQLALAVALPLLAVAEVVPGIAWEHAPARAPRFYRWLADVRVGPVMEWPPEDRWSSQYLYLLYATEHRVPIMNGTSGFEPPLHYKFREAWAHLHMDDSLAHLLERTGCKLLVVHADQLGERRDATLAWVEELLETGRIEFVRRFDSGVNGDWVFAFPENLPDWKTYRDLRTDEAGLQRFLRGEATYNEGTFWRVETPQQYEEHRRELRIAGWALSPHGIRSATALIHNQRIRVPMKLYERGDVKDVLPWYPETTHPGFGVTVPKRPKGVPRQTDIQIEIVDGSGAVWRSKDIVIWWD